MSDKKLVIIPMFEDLLAAGVAAAAGSFQKQNPGQCALEQLVSAMVAKNVASYTQYTDSLANNSMPVPVSEADMLTGVVRAGYNMYKGGSGQTILLKGLGGVFAQIVGLEIKKSFFGA